MIRSSHGSKVLRRSLVGGIALLIPVLAGCEAGDNAPTLEFHPAANGAYASAGDVQVNDAFILGGAGNSQLPKGGSASLFLSVYNGSASSDKLVSVSASGAATSAQITGGSVALPGQTGADLSGPAPKIVLKGLKSPLTSGKTVDVVLTFANAGAVDLTVPVEAKMGYYSAYSPAPGTSPTKKLNPGATSPATSPSAGASGTASGTASGAASAATEVSPSASATTTAP